MGKFLALVLVLAAVAAIGGLLYRPGAVIGVSGKSLAHSVGGQADAEETGTCVETGDDDSFICTVVDADRKPLATYSVKTKDAGCWDGTRKRGADRSRKRSPAASRSWIWSAPTEAAPRAARRLSLPAYARRIAGPGEPSATTNFEARAERRSAAVSGVAAKNTLMEPAAAEPARAQLHRSSLVGLVIFVTASVILVAMEGVPLSREVIFLWVLVGLLVVSAADLRGWARGLIFDWLPFFAMLFAYDLLRGWVGNNPLFEPHVLPQIDVDEFLFGFVPPVELQQALYEPGVLHWYDVAAWAIYLTHFFAAFAIAGYLWHVARPRFLQFRAMVITLSAAAFATYALFPAVPPWMASDDGVIGPVTRVVGGVWGELGVEHAAAIWDRGSTFSNEVAAMPSLHTAFPVLFLCFFWAGGTRVAGDRLHLRRGDEPDARLHRRALRRRRDRRLALRDRRLPDRPAHLRLAGIASTKAVRGRRVRGPGSGACHGERPCTGD